jgi:hypothetical protein
MKKIIKSKWLIFFIGFITGITVCKILISRQGSDKEDSYFKLKHDYCIEDVGHLESGTIIKIDKGMSEGFTRYILYLNISDSQQFDKYETEQKNIVIPYWLFEKDSTCKY